jgi:hypothetical protein
MTFVFPYSLSILFGTSQELARRFLALCFPLVLSQFVSLQNQFSQEFSQTLQYIPFSAAVAGTGQVSLPGADVFRQVTACHWSNMWQI